METMAVLLLLLILGTGIFALAVSSTSAYSKIYDGRNDASELRVALAFISMKIRQNDIEGAVEIRNNPVNGGPAVVIREEYEKGIYETWIYHDSGKLREAIMPEGMDPFNEYSFEIADIDGFSAEMQGNLISMSVWIDRDDGRQSLESCIRLRTE